MPSVVEYPPSSTCQFQLDEDKGSRRDFLLACPIALAAATASYVLPDRWFTPHFAVYAEFSLSLLGMPPLIGLGLTLPFGLLVGFNALIALGPLRPEMYRILGMFTSVRLALYLFAVREQLFRLCNSPDVDSSWLLWSRGAEASLARAYLAAEWPSPL